MVCSILKTEQIVATLITEVLGVEDVSVPAFVYTDLCEGDEELVVAFCLKKQLVQILH